MFINQSQSFNIILSYLIALQYSYLYFSYYFYASNYVFVISCFSDCQYFCFLNCYNIGEYFDNNWDDLLFVIKDSALIGDFELFPNPLITL